MSQVLAQAALCKGMDVKTAEFTNEPLMSSEICHIRLGETVDSPLIMKGESEVLVGFDPFLAIEIASYYLSKEGLIIMNMKPGIQLPELRKLDGACRDIIKIDVFEIARHIGNIGLANFVMLGVLKGTKVLPITTQDIANAIQIIEPSIGNQSLLNAIEAGEKSICQKGEFAKYI